MQDLAAAMVPPFSFAIVSLMLLVLAASGAVFYFLSVRWTRDRRKGALVDWADEQNFRLRLAPDAQLPTALHSLGSLHTQVEASLVGEQQTFARVATRNSTSEEFRHWNVLIRETNVARVPAGLRPLNPRPSFLDLFSLTDFPSAMVSERFLVCALDSRAAKEMAKTSARGLMPADIGLILHGPYITLDFSSRPFDTIEFERMLAVMQQIVEHLPPPAKSR